MNREFIMYFVVLYCLFIATVVNGFRATLYSNADWKGNFFTRTKCSQLWLAMFWGQSFDTGERKDDCVNIPTSMLNADDGISSIDTHGRCVVVYDVIVPPINYAKWIKYIQKANCDGRHVIMRPGTESHGYFRSLHFNDQTKSVGPCVFNDETTELRVDKMVRLLIYVHLFQ